MDIQDSIPPSATSTFVTVEDALQALSALNHEVVLLNHGNAILQKDYNTYDKVRILSGGVAGNDLSHALFVGKGMLTGAVLGDSVIPSSRQILRAIKELNQGNNYGIFVIVQANAELFNFGLAVERANIDCRIRTKLLTIDDDRSELKERYSCGFIILSKVLGAMAERKLTFDNICKCYNEIVHHIITLPMNYVQEEGPGKHKVLNLNEFQIIELDSKLQLEFRLHHSVALINTSNLERLLELHLVKLVIERLRQLGVCLIRIYCGNFVSTGHGKATLTIMKIFDNKIIEYLDDPCNAPGWCHAHQFLPEVTLQNGTPGLLAHRGKQQIPLKGARIGEIDSLMFIRAVQFACDALISCERQLNIIDSEKSKGNMGTRLKNLAENVNTRLKNNKMPIDCPYAFFKKLAIIAEMAVSGTIGSVYGVFFESAAEVFGQLPENDYIIPIFLWAKAFIAGSQAVIELCAPEAANTTICYPIKCCQTAMHEAMHDDHNYMHVFGAAVNAAEEAAEKTRIPPYKLPDSGAHSVGIWMRAVYEAVRLMNSLSSSEMD